jgi:NTP pyrophosphatase (non-canonical NTP hydrolase)
MSLDVTEQLVINWADDRGILDPLNGSDTISQYIKLHEEQGELLDALRVVNQDLVKDAIGDIMVVLTIIANLSSLNLSQCYEAAYEEIKNRKGKMVRGIFVKEQ